MPSIIRSERAKADLLDIWLYIATRDNSDVADRFLAKLYLAIKRIAVFPYGGRANLLIHNDLRRIIYGSYLIYYLVHPNHIEIARVLHGARDQINVDR